MALSPWPSSPVALTAATRILKQVLPDNLTDERVQQLGAVGAALVEDYAPASPQAVKDQCVEMIAGYLAESAGGGFGAVRSESINLDSSVILQTDRVSNHAAAFRNCGAAGLLTRWKIRRAGAI